MGEHFLDYKGWLRGFDKSLINNLFLSTLKRWGWWQMKLITSGFYLERPLAGVIFDMDGVVLDTFGDQHEWLGTQATKFNPNAEFPLYDEEFRKRYNHGYKTGSYPGIYEEFGIDFEAHSTDIWAAFNAFYANRITPTCKVGNDDVADVIKNLFVNGAPSKERATRLRLAINTTKGHDNIYPSLTEAGIWECFDTVTEDDDIIEWAGDSMRKKNGDYKSVEEMRKDVPEGISRVLGKPGSLTGFLTMQKLGANPKSVIVLEDTASGIKTYKPLKTLNGYENVYVAGVSWGFDEVPDLIDAGADAILDSPGEILDLVQRLGGNLR